MEKRADNLCYIRVKAFCPLTETIMGRNRLPKEWEVPTLLTLNKERASIQNVENFQSSRIFKNGKVVEWASHKTGCPN